MSSGNTDMPAIQLETVTSADFMEVIAHTKPSARSLMDRYTAWSPVSEQVLEDVFNCIGKTVTCQMRWGVDFVFISFSVFTGFDEDT